MIISGNSIESLPILFTDSDHALESITANHNKLSLINSENLSGMLFLSLNDNKFTEAGIAQSLSNLPNLFHLSLENNAIEIIHKGTFSNQPGMQYLSVWKNELSFIQPGAVDHMTVLETLNLMENEDLDGYTTESWHFCHNHGIFATIMASCVAIALVEELNNTSWHFCDNLFLQTSSPRRLSTIQASTSSDEESRVWPSAW